MNGKKSNPASRAQDEQKIPNGRYFEPYSPASGQITSAALKDKNGSPRRLLYARICLSTDANVTFKDGAGNAVSAFALSKGEHFFLVTEVSVVSAGTLALIHDGEIDLSQDDATA